MAGHRGPDYPRLYASGISGKTLRPDSAEKGAGCDLEIKNRCFGPELRMAE